MSAASAILVFRSAALGDFILASPAFRLLRLRFPNSRIVLLTMQSSNKAIRESVARYSPTSPIPWVSLAMPHLIDEVVLLDPVAGVQSLLTLRRRLKALQIGRAFIFVDPGSPWMGRLKKLALLHFLLGWIPVLGWRAKGSLSGNPARLKQEGLLPHHVFGSTQFLKELNPAEPCQEGDIAFDLRVPPQSDAWAAALWQDRGLSGRVVLAISPGSIQLHKRWPVEKFQRLGQQLLEDYPDVLLLVVGTPSDTALGAELASALGERAINLAGQTGVLELAALLKRCRLVVGNDGGAMHLADAMGCQVVSIVPGIQYPDSIEPWNNRKFAVRHAVPCAPCYSFQACPLGHNKCMVDLPVAAVLSNCRHLLGKALSVA